MSQYPQQGPSPYSPLPPQQPGFYYGADPYEGLLAPARRASIMMYIAGALMLLGGLCCGILGFGMQWDQLLAQQPDLAAAAPELNATMIRAIFVVFAVLSFGAGALYLIFAYFVRNGGMGAVVGSLVVTSLAVVLILVNIVTSVLRLQAMEPPQLIGALCVNIVPLALFGLLLGWLIQAARNAPRVQSMQAQYQMQYWQQYQQQQGYQQQPQQPQAGGVHAQQQQPPRPPS